MGLTFRPAHETELPEITRQWTSSFEPSWPARGDSRGFTVGSMFRSISPALWRRAHRALVESLLGDAPECVATVLVLDSTPSEPLGWVVTEGTHVHYVYVLDKARRRGLGRMLISHARRNGAATHTHLTAGGSGLLRAMGEPL